MTGTLTIWDFDDTLANSATAVNALSAANPTVAIWKWWHIAAFSTQAAENTTAITAAWLSLDATAGEHIILTGRNADAVNAWLDANKDHPVIGSAVRKITRVISTSHNGSYAVSGTTASRKATIIANIAANYSAVTFVDDTAANLDAVNHIANVTTTLAA